MTQYFVNVSKANSVTDNAPTIKTVEYGIKNHTVLIELFDYGYPMWGEQFSPKGTDIRERFFFDGVRVELDTHKPNGRYSWFPKDITRKLWNEKLLENGFNIFGQIIKE
tara:strand:- start:447 stop:773 length:327 start_codon:yes stop_codon:yes gene_type:complete